MIAAIKGFFALYSMYAKFAAVGVVVALLLAGWWKFAHHYKEQGAAAMKLERDAALASLKSSKEAAAACSDSVKELADKATARHQEMLLLIEAAAKAALNAETIAKKTLASQPKYPADLCRSAREANDEWLKARRERAK